MGPRSLLFSAADPIPVGGTLRDVCVIEWSDCRVLIYYLRFLPHDIGLIM